MHLSLQEIMVRVALLPMAAAVLIGLLRFRGLPLHLRYLVGMVGFALVMNVVALLLMLRHSNNLFIMPFYAAVEFTLLTVVYSLTLRSATFSRFAPWLVAGFAAYILLDGFSMDKLARFRPGQQVVQSVLVLGLVGIYFRHLLQELRVQQLQREPMFWVSAGLVIYRLGYLQIALFSNYLLHYSDALNMTIWAVHSLLLIALYSCYCLALWLRPQTK